MSDAPSDAKPAAPQDSRQESGVAKPWKTGSSRASSRSTSRPAGSGTGSRKNASPRTTSSLPSGWGLAGIGWALFIVFLTYFNITSNLLPYGAGPDYAAHDDASRFIYRHGRLAVLPQDEDKLKFTPYGGTRVLRPPLSYMLSAKLAKLLDNGETRQEILFRKSSALLSALSVFVIFWCGIVYFSSVSLALLGAGLVGLLPQFTFIASYNNDDAGAIFSMSLMLLAMVIVLRRGSNWKTLGFMGFAAGMVILTKQSAWLIAPTVGLFALFFILRHLPRVIGPIIVGLLVAALSGGWWIAKNIRDYGPHDPLLQKTVKEVAERHSRFSEDRKFGYAANGVSAVDLLRNHRSFLTATAISTVGNLDWLRLRVGKMTYWFYYALAGIGALYFLARLLSLVLPGELRRPGDLVFETLLVAALVFQFAMYMWANLYNDIQVQGKYLLPAVGIITLLSLAGLRMLGELLAHVMRRTGLQDITITPRFLATAACIALLATTALLHRNSLMNYVLPFYQPNFYKEPLRQVTLKAFVPISLEPSGFLASNQIDDAKLLARDRLSFESTGGDPWFVPRVHKCAGAQDNSLVRISLKAPAKGRFTVYWDDGDGFGQHNRSSVRYGTGSQELHIWIAPRDCRKLRFDPGVAQGRYVIEQIAVAQVDIGPIHSE